MIIMNMYMCMYTGKLATEMFLAPVNSFLKKLVAIANINKAIGYC